MNISSESFKNMTFEEFEDEIYANYFGIKVEQTMSKTVLIADYFNGEVAIISEIVTGDYEIKNSINLFKNYDTREYLIELIKGYANTPISKRIPPKPTFLDTLRETFERWSGHVI